MTHYNSQDEEEIQKRLESDIGYRNGLHVKIFKMNNTKHIQPLSRPSYIVRNSRLIERINPNDTLSLFHLKQRNL